MVNPHLQVSKVSKLGCDCTVQWDRTRASDTRLIFFFFIEKTSMLEYEKTKQPSNELTVNTSTTKFLTAETGAAQNPAE